VIFRCKVGNDVTMGEGAIIAGLVDEDGVPQLEIPDGTIIPEGAVMTNQEEKSWTAYSRGRSGGSRDLPAVAEKQMCAGQYRVEMRRSGMNTLGTDLVALRRLRMAARNTTSRASSAFRSLPGTLWAPRMVATRALWPNGSGSRNAQAAGACSPPNRKDRGTVPRAAPAPADGDGGRNVKALSAKLPIKLSAILATNEADANKIPLPTYTCYATKPIG
jgi:hypothetical protein